VDGWKNPTLSMSGKPSCRAEGKPPHGGRLLDAFVLINGARQDGYGPPRENLARGTMALCQAFLPGHVYTPRTVALMLALLKLAREAHGHKQDNLIDAAGYIALAADAINNLEK
jgi:hypothetical protein